MAKGTTIEKLFLSLGLDMTQLDSDLLTASKTVNQGMADLNRKSQQAKLKMDIDLSRFPDAEKSVEALTIKEKALSAQHDIQKQKVALVNAAYAESVAEKGKDDISSQKLLTRLLKEQKAEADLAAQIQKTNTTRAGLSRAVPNGNAGASNDATIALNNLSGAMGKVKNVGQAASGSVTFLNTKILALTAIAASGAGLFDLVKGAVAAGDAAYKLSSRLNLTTEESSKLNRILKMSEVDAQPFISTMLKIDRAVMNVGKNGNTVTDAMKVFDVSLTDANGSLLPINEQLEQLAKGYDNAVKAGEEEAFTMDILGNKGAVLVTMLKDYKDNAEAASRVTGLGIDPKQMHEMAIEMKVLDLEAGQMKNALGAALVPLAKDMIPDVISGFESMVVAIKDNKDTIQASIGIAIELLDVVRDLGSAVAEIPEIVFDLEGIHSAKDALQELKTEYQTFKDHPVLATLDAVSSVAGLPGDKSIFREKINEYKITAQAEIDSRESVKAAQKAALAESRKIADQEKKTAQEQANAVIQAKMKEVAALNANKKARLELDDEIFKANHTQMEIELHDIDVKSQKMIDDGVTETVAAEIAATRKKIIIDKNNAEIEKASEDLSVAIYKINHSALENRMVDIEKERQEWIKKTKDEVRATQLAEQEKQKAVKDTINSQYSEEVRAVKAAILAGTSLSDAYNDAHKKAVLDRDAQTQAETYASNKNGVYMPGDTKRSVVIDGNSAYQQDQIVDRMSFDGRKLPSSLSALPQMFGDGMQKAIEKVIKIIPTQTGNVSQSDIDSRASTSQSGAGRELTLNLQNEIEIKGFTSDEISKAVERAKDAFGQELMSAIQDANSVMGV